MYSNQNLTRYATPTPAIYRLWVDGKYVDYYESLKRANIAARVFINQGSTVEIIEDKLD